MVTLSNIIQTIHSKKNIGGACITYKKNRNRFGILMEKHEITGLFEMFRRRLKTVLKFILNKYDGRVYSGFT
jgi:hypothetical protein